MRNIPIAKPSIGNEEIQAVIKVMETGQLAQGEQVIEFENEYSQHFGHIGGAAVCNGTVAIHVALKAAGVKAGDIVITTPFSFVATTNAILYCDAIPVFVDIDRDTFNISPDSLRGCLKDYPEARHLLLVHLFGQACEMDKVMEIAHENDLMIIEDCAQAHGASFKSQQVGTFGVAGTFSFYPTKNMSTGEGGMITSKSLQFIEDCKLLINHGSKERYIHEILGFNYRMTNIAAAIGIEQLKKVEHMNNARRANAEFFHEHISNNLVILPNVHKDAYHVYHQYTLRTEHRDALMQYLMTKGIGTGVHYPYPLNKQEHIIKYISERNRLIHDCPVAEQISNEVISIPVHPSLTQNELEYICTKINEFTI